MLRDHQSGGKRYLGEKTSVELTAAAFFFFFPAGVKCHLAGPVMDLCTDCETKYQKGTMRQEGRVNHTRIERRCLSQSGFISRISVSLSLSAAEATILPIAKTRKVEKYNQKLLEVVRFSL